ncbi:MAG TPA: radical SAM protein, partial [Elusimicrobiota bacterium]|nr:radical SAM protein [Elusimicrobiota bacterium]
MRDPARRARELDERTLIWLGMQTKPDFVPAGQVTACAVDSGSLCNLRCPFCATGNGSLRLSREFLTKRAFARILNRLPSLKVVSLYQWGEPLLNADIYDMIEAAARGGAKVHVSTNFSLDSFDDAAARRLVSSGLTRLIVSCDGASQRTYEQYRVGGDFSLVMRNLATLIAAKRAMGSPSPRIDWQFLVHRGNQEEIGTARRMARSLGIEIVFEKLGIPSRFMKRWSPDPAAMRPIPLKQRRSPKRTWTRAPDKWPSVCLQTWDMPVIHSDGTVLPCCVVSDSRYGLGNIFKEPFRKIWNKPLIVAMRRYLKAGRKSKL